MNVPGQKIRGRGVLGWTIVVLLMGAALGLAIHVPDSGPHQFTAVEDTTPTSADGFSTTTEPTDTTTESAPSTSTSSTSSTSTSTTSTSAPKADNVLVGNTLLVRSASQDGNDYPIQNRLTITFRQNGSAQSATWTGGCNTISAPVVIHANTIDVGPISSTAADCPSPVGEEETFLTALMRANPHWDLQGGAVVLDGGGRRAVCDAYAN